MKGAIGAYHENAVTTQTRGRLIVLLYEGAITFLEQAKAELAETRAKLADRAEAAETAAAELAKLRADRRASGLRGLLDDSEAENERLRTELAALRAGACLYPEEPSQ